MNNQMTISRRGFLQGAGALVVSFSLWSPLSDLMAQNPAPPFPSPEATDLDSWLAIAADGKVTMYTSKVDLGTGVVTALSQIVAEELDVPFSAIHMETGDTSQTIDQAATVGSATISRGGPQLRQAAAAARFELLKLASMSLQTPVDRLAVTDGVVSVAAEPARKVSYGELVGGKHFDVKITATGAGRTLQVAPEVKPKDPKSYKIVGTSVSRVDLPPKFTGEFIYTADVRLPGMLHGRIVRPATTSTKPVSVDESSVKGIPGIVKIVQEGNFVGVVATTEWAAIQAAKKLKVTWSVPEHRYPASRDGVFEFLKTTKPAREQSVVSRGNVDTVIGQAAKPFEAIYYWPFQIHGMLGPSCAVADVQANSATIWAGSQGTFGTRSQVANLLKLPERNVRVIYREGSGCYGRLSPDDAPLDAALLSRAVGKPVRVHWTREEEHGWSPKGPAQLLTVRAATDGNGNLTAWDFLDRSFPWTENGNPLLAARQVGIPAANPGLGNGTGAGGQIYRIDNQKVVAAMIPWVAPDAMPLRTSNLRAPGDLARCFASECAMDEIAAMMRVDPVELRRRHLTDERILAVLSAAGDKAQWKPRTAPAASVGGKVLGRGVAVANRDETMTAAIADVEVDRTSGKVTVHRITLAQDCGLIVNPDGVKNQIEGNVIQGVSRTLLEEVKFDASGIKSLDWVSYPIVHFPDVPEIDIILINRPEMPSFGGGEPSLVPVPAAIANAVFDAVGVRLREIPLTAERVLAALKAGVSSSQL